MRGGLSIIPHGPNSARYGTSYLPYVIVGVESIPPGLAITLDGTPTGQMTPGVAQVPWGSGRRVGVMGSSPSQWEASTPLFNLSPPDTSPLQSHPGSLPALVQEALRDWPMPQEVRGDLQDMGYISAVKPGSSGKWLTVVFTAPAGARKGTGGPLATITRRDGVVVAVVLGVLAVAGVVGALLFGRNAR